MNTPDIWFHHFIWIPIEALMPLPRIDPTRTRRDDGFRWSDMPEPTVAPRYSLRFDYSRAAL